LAPLCSCRTDSPSGDSAANDARACLRSTNSDEHRRNPPNNDDTWVIARQRVIDFVPRASMGGRVQTPMLIACHGVDEEARILDALAPVRPALVTRTIDAAVTELARRPFHIVLSSLDSGDSVRLCREAARLRPESVRVAVAERGDAILGSALAHGTLHDVVFSPWTAHCLRSAVDRAGALAKARQALLGGD